MSARTKPSARSVETFGRRLGVGRYITLARTSKNTGKTSFGTGVVVAMRVTDIGRPSECAEFLTMPVVGEPHAHALWQGATWQALIPDTGHSYESYGRMPRGFFVSGTGGFDVTADNDAEMQLSASTPAVHFMPPRLRLYPPAARVADWRPLDRVYVMGKHDAVYVKSVELRPVNDGPGDAVNWGVRIETNAAPGHPNIIDHLSFCGDGSAEWPFMPRLEQRQVPKNEGLR